MPRFIDRTGEVSYNNQGEKMTIISYRNYDNIDVQFEDGSIAKNKAYNNFKKGSIKHPIRYEESFAYHIEIELELNLDDIWNWEKNDENGINPYEITKCSTKNIWVYCLKHDYHNYDRESNKIGYETTCDKFSRGSRCSYCHRGLSKVHWKDSLAYNYPNIAKMIAIEENDLTFDDCYNIYCNSHKYFYFKCNKCDEISSKRKQLKSIVMQGYSCAICSDNIYLTEKFTINILKQLKLDYIYQLSKKDFKWCNEFRYDFYIYDNNCIIETHGIQHYEENKDYKQSLNEVQMNDLFKYKCAKNYVDNYIIIDCRYSTLEWMKKNVIKELGEYFDLSTVNWELAWEESQNSLCVKTWELWNNGIHNTKDIGEILGLNYGIVRIYLERGEKCGKCNCIKEILTKNRVEKISGKNNYLSKSVICITTGKIFDTIKEAEKYYNCYGVGNCCNNKRKTAGKLSDGTKLEWKYYEDYIKEDSTNE